MKTVRPRKSWKIKRRSTLQRSPLTRSCCIFIPARRASSAPPASFAGVSRHFVQEICSSDRGYRTRASLRREGNLICRPRFGMMFRPINAPRASSFLVLVVRPRCSSSPLVLAVRPRRIRQRRTKTDTMGHVRSNDRRSINATWTRHRRDVDASPPVRNLWCATTTITFIDAI